MIVELMHISDITQDKIFVKNALILILAFITGKFKDTYEYKTKDLTEVFPKEKDSILNCLEKELL